MSLIKTVADKSHHVIVALDKHWIPWINSCINSGSESRKEEVRKRHKTLILLKVSALKEVP